MRDIIISGDPMMPPDHMIEWILSELRAIPHVEILRIGSRVPCAPPQRITPELCEIIKRYHPVYVNTHFNHPREVTEVARKHCGMLADAGVPIGCQTVLLKGVNDDPAVMKELMQKLLTIRVRPYYIYQADLTKGTNYFRTRVEKGLEIIKACGATPPAWPCPTSSSMPPAGAARSPPARVRGGHQRPGGGDAQLRGAALPLPAGRRAGPGPPRAAGADGATRSHTLRLEPAAPLD